ncbi:MAG: hypothetical protein WBN03_00305 [Desulfobacterales bacterium]
MLSNIRRGTAAPPLAFYSGNTPSRPCRIFHTIRNPLRKDLADATRLTSAVFGELSH